jgi:hypothetical protein
LLDGHPRSPADRACRAAPSPGGRRRPADDGCRAARRVRLSRRVAARIRRAHGRRDVRVAHRARRAVRGRHVGGYNLLNDTAIHPALVDWIADHGTRYTELAPSSYAAAIDEYVGSSYPLGSHELLAALHPVTGLDPALIYQPLLALAAGLAAAALYALLRAEAVRPAHSALAAFAAMASQLVFSCALQGGIKEITFISCLAAAAALAAQLGRFRRPVAFAGLLALPAAAMYTIYSVYAMPWIAPIALVAVWLARRERAPLRGPLIAGVVVFAAAIAVDFKGSIDYYRHGHDVITSGSKLGPLVGPLKLGQVFGIWLNGDYRFTPVHSRVAWLLVVVAARLRGAWAGDRGQTRLAGMLLLVAAAVVAPVLVAPAGSPYIDAKLLAILSPAAVLLACLGLARLRMAGIVLARVLGIGLLVSDALAPGSRSRRRSTA